MARVLLVLAALLTLWLLPAGRPSVAAQLLPSSVPVQQYSTWVVVYDVFYMVGAELNSSVALYVMGLEAPIIAVSHAGTVLATTADTSKYVYFEARPHGPMLWARAVNTSLPSTNNTFVVGHNALTLEVEAVVRDDALLPPPQYSNFPYDGTSQQLDLTICTDSANRAFLSSHGQMYVLSTAGVQVDYWVLSEAVGPNQVLCAFDPSDVLWLIGFSAVNGSLMQAWRATSSGALINSGWLDFGSSAGISGAQSMAVDSAGYVWLSMYTEGYPGNQTTATSLFRFGPDFQLDRIVPVPANATAGIYSNDVEMSVSWGATPAEDRLFVFAYGGRADAVYLLSLDGSSEGEVVRQADGGFPNSLHYDTFNDTLLTSDFQLSVELDLLATYPIPHPEYGFFSTADGLGNTLIISYNSVQGVVFDSSVFFFDASQRLVWSYNGSAHSAVMDAEQRLVYVQGSNVEDYAPDGSYAYVDFNTQIYTFSYDGRNLTTNLMYLPSQTAYTSIGLLGLVRPPSLPASSPRSLVALGTDGVTVYAIDTTDQSGTASVLLTAPSYMVEAGGAFQLDAGSVSPDGSYVFLVGYLTDNCSLGCYEYYVFAFSVVSGQLACVYEEPPFGSVGLAITADLSNRLYMLAGSLFIFPPPPSTPSGGVKGDPSFIGLLGQQYQVHGLDGEVYALVSAPRLQVNALFSFLSSGRCPMLDGAPDSNCWSHPGSYLSAIGLLHAMSDSSLHRLTVTAGPHDRGFSRVELDGRELTVGASVSLGSLSITYAASHRLAVSTEQLGFVFHNSDGFINQEVAALQPLQALRAAGMHGLLGQTHSSRRFNTPLRVVEGQVDEYLVPDRQLHSTDFLYSRFQSHTDEALDSK